MQEQKQSAELSFDAPSFTDLNALDFHLKLQKGQAKERPPIKEENNESCSSSAVFASAASGNSQGKKSADNPHEKVESPHEQLSFGSGNSGIGSSTSSSGSLEKKSNGSTVEKVESPHIIQLSDTDLLSQQ